MIPAVYIRSPNRPFKVLASIKAYDIERSFMLMERSQASFSVSRNDPALTAEIMQAGNVVEIVGNTRRTWVGILKSPEEEFNGESEHWTCEDLLTQLDECLLPPSWNYTTSTGAGVVWQDIYNEATRGRMVVADVFGVAVGPPVQHDFSNATLLSAINDLAVSVRWEYDIKVQRRPFIVTLYFLPRVGQDLTQRVRITNAHVAGGKLIVDTKGSPHVVRAVGVASAVQVTRGAAPPAGSTADTMVVNSYSPPTIQEHRAVFDVNMDNVVGMAAVAQAEITTPRYGIQRVECDMNMLMPWNAFDVGDSVIGVFSNLRHGSTVEGIMRVTGMQPSEERGVMSVVLEDQSIWQ